MDDKERFNHAFETYCRFPSLLNGIELYHLTRKQLFESGARVELARLGPALAIFEVLLSRRDVKFRGLKLWTNQKFIQLLHWQMRRQYRTRPLWNDYYMCRFLLTGEREAAEEIHCRARHIQADTSPSAIDPNNPWSMIAFTAEWMASSQRSQHPEFDQVLKEIESTCANCLGPADGRTLYGSVC